MKLSVIIPVYNEINTFLEMLRQVEAVQINKEIIIVDDGSTDGTRDILKALNKPNITVLLNERNRGKGFSIRRGFEHATGDVVIIQDADLEYYPDEYPQLIEKIVQDKADVVYGTRFMGSHRVFHFYHYAGNKLLNFITNVFYNTNLSDLMTCYKVFKADVIKSLKLRADGFGIEAEMTAQIFKRKLRVYEVPISYNGRDYDEGKKITWRDFFASLYWLIRCKYEVHDVGEDTLFRMKMMKNNNRWLFRQFKDYAGSRILEIGSGIGNISNFIVSLNRKLVVLTEINANYISYLKHKFIGNPGVKILPQDIASSDISALKGLCIDTAVCINVLEHIQDDNKVLRNINSVLADEGRLILIVPALPVLYGTLDEKVLHVRRYSRKDLINKLEANGFVLEKIYYHNLLATFGWFLNGRILKRHIISGTQAALLDKVTPMLGFIEKHISIPFGLSLIAVCKKSGQANRAQE